METELYGNNQAPVGISLNDLSENFLRSAAKWGKFLAIVGFVAIALMVFGGLFAGALLTVIMGHDQPLFGLGGGSVVVFSFMAIIYFFPVLYLYKFSSKMSNGLDAKNEDEVAESLRNLKSLFKFLGIFTIVMIGLYALSIVFAVIGVSMLGM